MNIRINLPRQSLSEYIFEMKQHKKDSPKGFVGNLYNVSKGHCLSKITQF